MLFVGARWQRNLDVGFEPRFLKELPREERENLLDLVEESELLSRSLDVENEFTDEGGAGLGEVPRTCCCRLGAPTGRAEMARGMADREKRRSAESFMALWISRDWMGTRSHHLENCLFDLKQRRA